MQNMGGWAGFSRPRAVRKMFPTRPPVRIRSATPRSRTVVIIRNASEIFAPPSTNTQGRFGASITWDTVQNSFSNSRPM